MSVKTNVRDNLAVIIMSDNVNWVQLNRGTEICSVRLRPDKAGAILVTFRALSLCLQDLILIFSLLSADDVVKAFQY